MKGNIGYDILSWIFNIMVDIFFREVRPRGAHRIPQEGPVIFVAAPHANQVSCYYMPFFLQVYEFDNNEFFHFKSHTSS